MPEDQIIIGLPGFKVLETIDSKFLEFSVLYTKKVTCIYCESENLRTKDSFIRRVRHTCFGEKLSILNIKAHKYKCLDCGKYFNQRFPGIYPRKRSTELFRKEVYRRHTDGVTQKKLSKRLRIGQATVERWSHEQLQFAEKKQDRSRWPMVLGIDEHFFTRKKGYATTFADLSKRKVFDVALGRSGKALKPYLNSKAGKDRVRAVVMDLSETYRSIARNYFPNAKIVADRFHVIRLVNHKFMEVWKLLDPEKRSHRGLISLMRRHHYKLSSKQRKNLRRYLREVPGLEVIYDFKSDLMELLSFKTRRKSECRILIPRFLRSIEMLRGSSFVSLRQLGETLDNWKEEIVRMWRFSKTNSITEGLHNKMEELSRRAYGFRSFKNYRLRVRVFCGY